MQPRLFSMFRACQRGLCNLPLFAFDDVIYCAAHCFERQDELLLTFLDINWALESAAWHRLKKKSPVIAQIRIYTTGISSSISPLSSNPFILEIVLTTVTGEIASRFTKERLQSFFFFFFFLSGDDNINKVFPLSWCSESYMGAPGEDYLPLNTVFIFELNQVPYRHTHTHMHTLEKVHTHTHTWQQKSLSNFKVCT